jgi:hypothetical protein
MLVSRGGLPPRGDPGPMFLLGPTTAIDRVEETGFPGDALAKILRCDEGVTLERGKMVQLPIDLRR